MAIPDSTTQTPSFITDAADFSKPIILASTYSTSVATATNGGDQRARWRNRPRYSLNYFLGGMTMAQFSIRRSKMIKELQAPIVVPIWTDSFVLSSMSDATHAQFGVSLAQKKFKVNSYAYFIQGSNQSFRLITAIGTTSLAFASGSFPTYTSGALVYPCIFGKRVPGNNSFTAFGLTATDEQIAIEEL